MWFEGNVAFFSVVLLLAVALAQSGAQTSGQNCDCCHLVKQVTNRKLDALERKIDQLLMGDCAQVAVRDCSDLYKCGKRRDGVYTIQPDAAQSPFDVFCDMTTAGGGWTVFQKRLDGSVRFFDRGWSDYKNGFGNLNGEAWLGLDKMNRMTNARRYRLRVDLQETNGNQAHAEYDYFSVSSERTNYKLGLGTYSGDAGDGLGRHRGYPFSTKDRDNDAHSGSCSAMYGAWWYTACHTSNLNGKYLHGAHTSYADGINWKAWKGYHYSAARAEMKIRPVDFV